MKFSIECELFRHRTGSAVDLTHLSVLIPAPQAQKAPMIASTVLLLK
jgi:hypothetical protein